MSNGTFGFFFLTILRYLSKLIDMERKFTSTFVTFRLHMTGNTDAGLCSREKKIEPLPVHVFFPHGQMENVRRDARNVPTRN